MEFKTTVASPVGRILLVSDGRALTALLLGEGRGATRPGHPCVADDAAAPFPQARRELEEYFMGRRTHFTIPLAPRGTPFQERVWRALRSIPRGSTATYGDVARAVGSPAAVRAVGGALGRNPLAIVVPCHRVVGSDGSLTGYAGGLARKRTLLAIEAAPTPRGSSGAPGNARPVGARSRDAVGPARRASGRMRR